MMPTLTVSTAYPSRTVVGGLHVPGGSDHLEDAKFLSPAQLAMAHDLARAVYHELRRAVPELRHRTASPWWRVVRFSGPRLDFDTREYAAWLAACSIPNGRVIPTTIGRSPAWLVESWPACTEAHAHSPRMLNDGRTVCVDKRLSAAAVRRLDTAGHFTPVPAGGLPS